MSLLSARHRLTIRIRAPTLLWSVEVRAWTTDDGRGLEAKRLDLAGCNDVAAPMLLKA
jgi:hypothetical protein